MATFLTFSGGSCGVVARPLASHLGEPGSIPGAVDPGFSHVGIVPGRWHWSAGFLWDLPFPSPCSTLTSLHAHWLSRSRSPKNTSVILGIARFSSWEYRGSERNMKEWSEEVVGVPLTSKRVDTLSQIAGSGQGSTEAMTADVDYHSHYGLSIGLAICDSGIPGHRDGSGVEHHPIVR
ncbi:hypothetical protein PR048_018529 [Dryococelus australis]|uniref:Uncharacterized protein n=1 Tax=Dryococelus australis TaxID=614101 RepID=A0ABQ9HCL8_9NEOP|nr:hypothetical protein PR048_018529 [Dryococelus australis]